MSVGLVKVYNTNNIPEISVLKSRLEAAGLHPFVQNFEHAQMAHIDILALGGMNILIPEEEAEEAMALIHSSEGNFLDTDIFDDYDAPWAEKEPYKANIHAVIILVAIAFAIIIFTNADGVSLIFLVSAAILYHAQTKATRIQARKDKEKEKG